MTTFNFRRYIEAQKKKGDGWKNDGDMHIDQKLEKLSPGDAPEKITEKQLDSGYRGEEKEITTEKRLDAVRQGAAEMLTEGLLNASKSTLHKHRDEKTAKGDINKLEEKRLADKKRQETEKVEPASETGKNNRFWETNTSKDDGLKLASWKWDFNKTSQVAPQEDSADSVSTQPTDAVQKKLCPRCGKPTIGKDGKCPLCDAAKNQPIPLDPGKMMPKIQESVKTVKTAKWDFDDDPEAGLERSVRDVAESEPTDFMSGEDPDLTPSALRELKDPKFDIEVEDTKDLDFNDKDDSPEPFEESVVGKSSATGTKFEIVEVVCSKMESYENEFGQLDEKGKKKLSTDVLAYIVSRHPEMAKKCSQKMLDVSKINDGKFYYLRAL